MTADPALVHLMTADEFFASAENWVDGERYELVNGHLVRLHSERVSHAERKASAWLALRQGLRSAKLTDCQSFPDGVSVRIGERTVREPAVIVNCGSYDGDKVFAPNPIIVVEDISPSSVRTDVDRKLIDYFAVASILHYIIIYGDDGRVVHHHREASDGEIRTVILAREATIELTPPGFSVTVEALLES